MSISVNLRHLEKKNVHLCGEMDVAELELEGLDELVHVPEPLAYDIEVEELDGALLAQGSLHLKLRCECVRCLKSFTQNLDFPNWTCHMPLSGEDKVEVVNDSVDLTPHIREDILLAFPQHPLCKAGCKGLPGAGSVQGKKGRKKADEPSSAWSELDKLKF